MRGEYNLLRSQLKGYLFEITLIDLLRKNDFALLNANHGSRERIRENREGFIEIRGRGCWHQIDCPFDYKQLIPFSYPLRLLGEAKFYTSPLDKKHIRSFIGVIKDIQENYFIADGVNIDTVCQRMMEIGTYFAANGFQAEAEKLAYVHGIKTISYANNFLIDKIKSLIINLEENYLSVNCMKNGNWSIFRRSFSKFMEYQVFPNHEFYWEYGYQEVLSQLQEQMSEIQTSFIGTTSTGVFIHFTGENTFPGELFRESDNGRCRVFWGSNNFGNRFFWLEISQDPQRRRFYFTPPESLDEAAVFGKKAVLNQKERLFHKLNVNINLNGISRNLTLHIDSDWLDFVRNRED